MFCNAPQMTKDVTSKISPKLVLFFSIFTIYIGFSTSTFRVEVARGHTDGIHMIAFCMLSLQCQPFNEQFNTEITSFY